jgi:hypothetical protein
MRTDPPSLDQFCLTDEEVARVRARRERGPPRHRQGELFLNGPVPWAWLVRAGQLPGSALHVGLVLWLEAGMKGQRTVRLSLSRLACMGVGVQAARRGIRALKAAGLVAITHRPGQSLEVTIREPA